MASFRNGSLGRSFSPESLAVVGRDFDGFFDQLFGSARPERCDVAAKGQTAVAAAHLWEQGDRLHVDIDLPGVNREDVSVTMEDGNLLIQAERKAPELGEHVSHHNTRFYGSYKQRVAVGDGFDPDSVDASLADGVLRIAISKRPEVKPKKIEIK